MCSGPFSSARKRYKIKVRATDQGGLWHDQKLTITIDNLPEPLTITGSARNDRITLTSDATRLKVSRNGSSRSYLRSSISTVTVDGLAGDDRITTLGDIPVTLRGAKAMTPSPAPPALTPSTAATATTPSWPKMTASPT